MVRPFLCLMMLTTPLQASWGGEPDAPAPDEEPVPVVYRPVTVVDFGDAPAPRFVCGFPGTPRLMLGWRPPPHLAIRRSFRPEMHEAIRTVR